MSAPHPTEPVAIKSAWPMFIGALVMIGVFLVIALLLRSVAPSGATDEVEKAELRRTNLADLHEADEAELTTYGWVDREKGTVRIPIREAMKREIAALNQQEPRPAYAIATPVPAPAEEAPAQDAAADGAPLEAADGENDPSASDGSAASTEPTPAESPASGAEPSATPGAPGAAPAESATPAPTSDQP